MEWSLRPDCVQKMLVGSTADADAEIIESHQNNAPHISIYTRCVALGHYIEAFAKLRHGVIFWSLASALVTRASPTDGMHAISDQR